MKVAFITSASLVTANPYTKAYFSVLRSQVSALPSLAHREMYKATTGQEWPLLCLKWPTKEDFSFSSALWTFWVSHQDFFFSLDFSKPGKYSRVWYINVLSYHDVNGIGLDFLPIFFPLVHEHRCMCLPCMTCQEMMSEDILSLVYIYLSENV